MTLHEKMEAAAEEASGDEDQAAENLKKSMTPAEKHVCVVQASNLFEAQPQRAEGFAKSQQNENGIAAAKWLMQKDGKKYLTTAAKVAARL